MYVVKTYPKRLWNITCTSPSLCCCKFFLNRHRLKFCGHESYNPSNSCWNSHCYIIMRLSVVCPSRIGCRSVWLKGTPNGSGLLPSPQIVYATAKIINTEFIELYSHRITYQLIWKLSLTPVSFISLSSCLCHGDDVLVWWKRGPHPSLAYLSSPSS